MQAKLLGEIHYDGKFNTRISIYTWIRRAVRNNPSSYAITIMESKGKILKIQIDSDSENNLEWQYNQLMEFLGTIKGFDYIEKECWARFSF